MRQKCKPKVLLDPVNHPIPHEHEACSLPRRCGALIYDGLILIAVWIVGSSLVVLPTNAAVEPGNLLFQGYLLVLTWGYFASGWLLGGQTVGMRAWNMRLISVRSQHPKGTISVSDSVVRVLVGGISLLLLGFGFLWALLRKDSATWHDLASRSRIIVMQSVEYSQ